MGAGAGKPGTCGWPVCLPRLSISRSVHDARQLVEEAGSRNYIPPLKAMFILHHFHVPLFTLPPKQAAIALRPPTRPAPLTLLPLLPLISTEQAIASTRRAAATTKSPTLNLRRARAARRAAAAWAPVSGGWLGAGEARLRTQYATCMRVLFPRLNRALPCIALVWQSASGAAPAAAYWAVHSPARPALMLMCTAGGFGGMPFTPAGAAGGAACDDDNDDGPPGQHCAAVALCLMCCIHGRSRR